MHGTGREDQAHRLRPQSARDEGEDLRRGAVEPLLVVDQADQRPLLRDLGQQPEHGQTDQEPVRRRPHSSRMRCGARHAAAPADARAGPAAARTAGAARRTRVPSPTGHPRRVRHGSRAPARPGTRAAPSCPRPPRRSAPAHGSHRRERPRSAGRAPRTHRGGPSAPPRASISAGPRPHARHNVIPLRRHTGDGGQPVADATAAPPVARLNQDTSGGRTVNGAAMTTIHHRYATGRGQRLFYREGRAAGRARRGTAARLSHQLVHVPEPDPAAGRPVSRDRPRPPGLWALRRATGG